MSIIDEIVWMICQAIRGARTLIIGVILLLILAATLDGCDKISKWWNNEGESTTPTTNRHFEEFDGRY